jgi:peptidoglycan/xylan/chitin deacetylase (PgdA/CDA1 family)
MRSTVAFCGLLAALTFAAPASANQCPGNPGALGTSRTLVVDPAEHGLLGGHQYRESLPLNDKEVVITFDDGPLPPYSTRILEILEQECVKATFFLVGRMARAYPKLVRRMHDEGHTLANHSQNHPFNFHRMSVEEAAREIQDGFNSIAAAVGDPAKVAPFFRFPGLLRQDSVEHYLKSKRVMAWSVDFMADDWTRINSREVVRRAIERLEAKGKGILLLHDIQPATALGLPELLRELKVRGYRVVHVVPATADRPRTATTPEQWVVRHAPSREQVAFRDPWPRAFPHRARSTAASFEAPSVTSFGAETPDDTVPVELVSPPEPLRGAEREVAMPTIWPEQVITIAALPEVDGLPAPAAANFRYDRVSRSHARNDRNRERRPNREVTRSVRPDAASTPNREPNGGKANGGNTGNGNKAKARSASRPIPPGDLIGHQIQLTSPQANLTRR